MPLLSKKPGRQFDSRSIARGRASARLASSHPPGISSLRLRPLAAPITLVALHEERLECCPSWPEESFLLRGNVVNKRRVEFALGRAAAHLALLGAGHTNCSPVLQKAGREPAWPAGFVGSITHCGSWAVAAAARTESLKSLGIDLEDVEAVPHEEIADLVCSDVEREWVFRGGNSKRKVAMLFSAKEAVYKALFPLCQKFFDFHAIELTWFPQSDSFGGVLLEELNLQLPVGYRMKIGCQQRANFVFTYLTIGANGAAASDANASSAT
ncbi:MAG: 4'-phosphopantetheinyl transferase superfamily protein [Candidatus Acidiferrales bacterium]